VSEYTAADRFFAASQFCTVDERSGGDKIEEFYYGETGREVRSYPGARVDNVACRCQRHIIAAPVG